MKILLINGGKAFAHSGGELNNTLHAVAVDTLKELGHEVRETVIEQGYEVATEVQNFLWADSIVYQMPGWWMGTPWTVKRYIDEVFTEQAVWQRWLTARPPLHAVADLERAD